MLSTELLRSTELKQTEKELFFQTYKRSDMVPVRGESFYLFDEDGNKYLDLVSGLGVNALGHSHPEIIKAVTDQVQKFSHLSNAFVNETQVLLAKKIHDGCGMPRVFFTNSGTEAVEGALKLIRRWAKQNNRREIFAFSKGFHGRSLGALSLTHKEKYREGFGPLMEEVHHLEFNSLDGLKSINEKTAAVFIEFVLGEGGVRPVSCEFADELQKLHEKFGFLLVADEIQAGFGRTGKFFAYQNFTLKPDIVVCAKPIGGGFPLGAILGTEKVADIWHMGDHGTTFGGNPIACAAGVVVMDWLLEQNGLDHVNRVGLKLRTVLEELKAKYPSEITEIRSMGLMGGIEFKGDTASLPSKGLQHGLIINSTDTTVIRLLPPLILTEDAVEEFKDKFIKVMEM